MSKNRIIIVEGPQGVGKTSLANFLRDNIAGSNLYRLSGQRDKSINGKMASIVMYNALLDYLEKMQNVPMDLVFDRTFFTEEVYARLGYKDYSFSDIFIYLVDRLARLNYDIYFINLYLEDTNIYNKRLEREHHQYQAFSIENSINQQNVYRDIANYLDNKGINVVNVPTDDFNVAYESIINLLNIPVKDNSKKLELKRSDNN